MQQVGGFRERQLRVFGVVVVTIHLQESPAGVSEERRALCAQQNAHTAMEYLSHVCICNRVRLYECL